MKPRVDRVLRIRLTPDVYKKVDALAAARGLSIEDFIVELLTRLDEAGGLAPPPPGTR